MNVKKIMYAILFLLLTVSCEGIHHVEGVVADAETKLPIGGALIIRNKTDTLYTDSLGRFEVSHRMTAVGPFGYPGMSVTFMNTGYETVKKRYRGWKDEPVTVFMKPNEH